MNDEPTERDVEALAEAATQPKVQCNWPLCHGAPRPCFAWCKCRCHRAAALRVTP